MHFKFIVTFAIITVSYHVNADNINGNAQIISQTNEQDPKTGSYNWNYQTSNGIATGEYGEGGRYAKGYYQYVGEDGIQYSVSYIADENGFRAEGAHLPTPPPTPDYILKSLEEIRLANLNKKQVSNYNN